MESIACRYFAPGQRSAVRVPVTDAAEMNMAMTSIRSRVAVLVVLGSAILHAASPKRELKVMTSGGFTAAYRELVPEFERSTGAKVITAYGASMGNAVDSIPRRLDRGEPVDVVILARPALDQLVKAGKVTAGSTIDLGDSFIAMVVRAGDPKPEIRTVEDLRRTLLNAKSIAYSASASGIYLSNELFPRLGIADQIKNKCKRVDSEMVGSLVARGEAEIGFQQLSELLPITGIVIVGPLPAEVQKITTFSGGVAISARQPELAAELLRFLSSPEALPAIERSGLHPPHREEHVVPKRGTRKGEFPSHFVDQHIGSAEGVSKEFSQPAIRLCCPSR
jgi:molybdate transport system substrate-binding protein